MEASAVTAATDGRFRAGPLRGRSINVKWYLKREGMVDIVESSALGYYLVLAGPASAAMSSRGARRPWYIEAVYLFDAKQLLDEQQARGAKTGIASSVRAEQWAAAEIYPRATKPALLVSPVQAELLKLFAPDLDDLYLVGVNSPQRGIPGGSCAGRWWCRCSVAIGSPARAAVLHCCTWPGPGCTLPVTSCYSIRVPGWGVPSNEAEGRAEQSGSS
jgi:hypothetical protein